MENSIVLKRVKDNGSAWSILNQVKNATMVVVLRWTADALEIQWIFYDSAEVQKLYPVMGNWQTASVKGNSVNVWFGWYTCCIWIIVMDTRSTVPL